MNVLPSSIESHLLEAGFSQTELLVLRHLMEGTAMTLRELAAKTGKSTGVLDQATKKLLRRNILSKEWVNDSYKYALSSLSAITKWMEQDTKSKREQLLRKHQNFEAFISSLAVDKNRPEMQYYEGLEGLQKAYTKLLECGKEFLHYFPVLSSVEDDPLRDFRVEYFRERRRRGIFSRVIIHNTPLGRRYQSRDVFEYRQSVLVPEDEYPFTFEKIIVGDVVACFNHAEKRACIMTYPELAQTERVLFERLWKQEMATSKEQGIAPQEVKPEPQVPLATRTLSSLREFFLSRKSLGILGVLALGSAAITYGLYLQNFNLNIQRVREKSLSIAATAALEFNSKDLDQLKTIKDIKKPEYAKVIKKLNEIRNINDGVSYAWIMRPASKKGYSEYIADADSLNPFAKIDSNYDGIINDEDQLQYPGQIYDEYDVYLPIELKQPFSTPEIHTDDFGTYFTTTAPIKNSSGTTTAFLGIDIKIKNVTLLTRESFNYFLCFIALFISFVLIRIAAYNRSLLKEIYEVLKIRKVIVITTLCAEIAFFITLGLYFYTLSLVKAEVGNKLMSIVATAAPYIDANDLGKIHWARDMQTEEYQRVFMQINKIRTENNGIRFVYILRPTSQELIYEYVADADSNYNLPYWEDANKDGIMQPDETNVAPGIRYYIGDYPDYVSDTVLTHATYQKDFYSDQWGTYLSASSPILKDGKVEAVLGVDMDVTDFYKLIRQRFAYGFSFIVVFILLLILKLLFSFENKK